jgi:hypothetical protein
VDSSHLRPCWHSGEYAQPISSFVKHVEHFKWSRYWSSLVPVFLAHDDRVVIYSGLNLSNDPWCLGAMGRPVLRNVPPTKTMALPVSVHFACSAHLTF